MSTLYGNDRIRASIAEACASLSIEELEALTDEQLRRVDATCLNWCETSWEENGFDSEDEAISAALFASYEVETGAI